MTEARGQRRLRLSARLVIMGLAFLHSSLYVFLTPPWQAPDETAHFEYAHLLASHWRPLTYADASPSFEYLLLESLQAHRAWDYVLHAAPEPLPERLYAAPVFGPSRTFGRFSLAYVPYALVAAALSDQGLEMQLYAMRLVSAVIAAFVVGVAYATAEVVEPGLPRLGAGVALIISFLPQHAYMMGTVNDGNLAGLLASFTLYAWLRGLQRGFTWRLALVSTMAGTLAVLTKATAFFLVPFGMLMVWSYLRGGRRAARTPFHWLQQRPWARLPLALGALSVPVAPLVCLAYTSPALARRFVTIEQNFLQAHTFGQRFVTIIADGQLGVAVLGLFTSYWGTFGWMVEPLPRPWYWLIGAACVLAAVGWLRGLRQYRTLAGRPPYALVAMAALLPIAVLFAWFLLSTVGIYGYQGRYLFAAVVPTVLLLVRGWLWLAPPAHAARVLVLGAAGALALAVAALVLVFVPFFYG